MINLNDLEQPISVK